MTEAPAQLDLPFEVVEPARQTLPLVFNSPHSGRRYDAEFLASSRLDATAIRRSEDSFVDELFLPAASCGAPMLRAHFPRAWLDVNREPYELDPAMFLGELPPFANTRSARVASGLGTIARIVSEREEIYARRLTVEEGLARIAGVYLPYHRALRRLVRRTRDAFGFAVLVDCHSMPSTLRLNLGRRRPDFVLGDRHGQSCARPVTDAAAEVLSEAGFSVARNKPYAGGFITEHYGRPAQGFHALQVEINRGLYLDEASLTPTADFRLIQAALVDLAGALAALDLRPAVEREAAE